MCSNGGSPTCLSVVFLSLLLFDLGLCPPLLPVEVLGLGVLGQLAHANETRAAGDVVVAAAGCGKDHKRVRRNLDDVKEYESKWSPRHFMWKEKYIPMHLSRFCVINWNKLFPQHKMPWITL